MLHIAPNQANRIAPHAERLASRPARSRLRQTNPTTGVLTEIGPTGLPDGLAGLTVVPEPPTPALLTMTVLLASRRRCRASGSRRPGFPRPAFMYPTTRSNL